MTDHDQTRHDAPDPRDHDDAPDTGDVSRVIRTRATAQGRFAIDVPPGWGQARGTFGGILLGAVVDAVRQSDDDASRRLRSITAEIAGPVLPGPASIDVVEVRRGAAVSTWSATMSSEGQPLVVANVVLGRDRDIDHAWQPEPPVSRPWPECPIVPAGPPLGPEFLQHLEIRLAGPVPFMRGPQAVTSGWVRPKRASAGIGVAELVAMGDAWWPTLYTIEAAPRPTATVSFFAQCFLGDRTLPGDVPLFHRARGIAAAGGYLVEHRELWTAEGELVLLNQQTFVIIR
jgi:hypothetical protein